MSTLPVVLLTGATGFVGQALLPWLQHGGYHVRALCRGVSVPDMAGSEVCWHRVPGLTEPAVLPLAACDAVIHLAARVHVMHERAINPLAAFRQVNVDTTIGLARAAAAAGVRRFVFLSSVKVNGEATMPGRPFCVDDRPAPEDAYGQSKLEAEVALHRVAEETGLEVVVIRPPLVYGPGVKGNFKTMLGWLQRGFPLPLASIDNRRSLVGVDNLCSLILACLEHQAAAGKTFMVSDGRDLSTPQLLRLAGDAIGRPARLWRLPPAVLQRGAALLGRAGAVQRLCGNLQVDIGSTREALGWQPPLSVEEGLRRILLSERRATLS